MILEEGKSTFAMDESLQSCLQVGQAKKGRRKRAFEYDFKIGRK